MNYGTLINGYPRLAPRMLINNGAKIFNPPDALYIEQGYLPITYTDAPTTDDEHYASATWTEQDGAIVQSWEISEIPISEEAEAIGLDNTTEILDGITALTRYSNEITGASDSTLSEAVETLTNHYKETD